MRVVVLERHPRRTVKLARHAMGLIVGLMLLAIFWPLGLVALVAYVVWMLSKGGRHQLQAPQRARKLEDIRRDVEIDARIKHGNALKGA